MINILDTDMIVISIRGRIVSHPRSERQRWLKASSERIVAHCKKVMLKGDVLGVSAVTVAELEYGAWLSGDYERESTALQSILTPFKRFDFDSMDCVAHYGRIRHKLQNEGAIIGPMDLLIAAHALALGATLVTNNTKEFKRVPGLKCENWSEVRLHENR